MSLFHTSFHREIDQIKKLNSFDDCPFLLEFQKKESMPSFNYISARLNDAVQNYHININS